MIDSTLLDVREDKILQPEPRLDLEEIHIFGENDERTIKIGDNLSIDDKAWLIELFK